MYQNAKDGYMKEARLTQGESRCDCNCRGPSLQTEGNTGVTIYPGIKFTP